MRILCAIVEPTADLVPLGSTPISFIAAEYARSGVVTRTEFGRAQFGSPSSGSRRGGGSPRPERFVSEDAERAAGCEMALDIERVLDSGVNRQESLG